MKKNKKKIINGLRYKESALLEYVLIRVGVLE